MRLLQQPMTHISRFDYWIAIWVVFGMGVLVGYLIWGLI